jgi:hypothetical protein
MRTSMSAVDGSSDEEVDPGEIDPFDKRWKLKSSDIKQITYRRPEVWKRWVSLQL